MKIQPALFLSALILANLACGLGSPAPAQGCDNPYYPVKDGATWEYELNGSKGMTRSLSNVTEKGFSSKEAMKSGTNLFSDLTCEQGTHTLAAMGFSLDDDPIIQFTTKSSKGSGLPGDLKVGSTWAEEFVYEGESDGTHRSYTMKNTCSAKDEASVTVPAGTFDTLHVECTLTISVLKDGVDTPTVTEVKSQFWYAAGVGMVKRNNLVEGYESEYLLTSYNIP